MARKKKDVRKKVWNPRIKRYVVIEIKPGRKPPARIVEVL